MKIPFNFGKKIKISINEEEYEEIPVTLKLKKNVAEVAMILAKSYHGPRKEDFNKFINEEVTKVIFSLALSPPQPPEFPDSLKQHIHKLLEEDDSR
jgi:hypothetical protein